MNFSNITKLKLYAKQGNFSSLQQQSIDAKSPFFSCSRQMSSNVSLCLRMMSLLC